MHVLHTLRFAAYINWLNERAVERLEYGCVMLYSKLPEWKEKISIVKQEDIYEKDNDYGYEKEPHMTIVYGIRDDEVDKQKLYEDISVLRPIRVSINTISYFENDEYDVVKFDVPVTPRIQEYRDIFMQFPNTQKFEGYHPHMTIAYVKKGLGKKYAQKVEPFHVIFTQAVYSSPSYDKKYFDLGT